MLPCRPALPQRLAVLATAVLLLAVSAPARSKKQRASQPQAFSYYLLSLSYAPDFCAQPNVPKDPRECGTGRHVGFVVHGLWPQADNGRGPERCGPASPVSKDVINSMLKYIPTESLIQHEWANHGTCSGLSAADYFAAIRKARDSVSIPDDLKQPGRAMHLSPADIQGKFAAANPRFPREAFRISCYRDGELQEARICFNKDLSPRGCGGGAGQCNTGSVLINPVR
ncbi:MAG TPA: ribonuclease T2 [Bryobacteraceae bacterium]|nr:ribonuclease T2 [Bryobacteraceae bacterium]